MLEDEVTQPQRGVVVPAPARTQKGFSINKIKTECDMIIMGFVVATMLLLLSDLFPKP